MADVIRRTPLDMPRAAPFPKSYAALICEDATILPIEERLGRRVLRTIDPESREGRDLLRRGAVLLRGTEGTVYAGLPVSDVLDRISSNTARRGAKNQSDPLRESRRHQARRRIGALRRSLSLDH